MLKIDQESIALLIEGDIMSLGLQIFFKVLLYSILIMIVRGVISKVQKPKKEVTNTELGERFIDWKIFSIIYMIVAIGFSVIFIFALTLPSNIPEINRGIGVGFFVFLIMLFLLMSFLYGRVYVKIGKSKIYWRKMNGKEYEIKYEEITSYKIDDGGNLKLYQGDKCILSFATGVHKVFITEVLKNHRIEVKDDIGETLILKSGKGYVIFYAVFCACSFLLFLMCAYYGILIGVVVFFLCVVLLLMMFVTVLTNKITIEKNVIFEKKLFRKRKINFAQVDYLSLKRDNNVEIICVHSNQGMVIKIPKSYQNIEIFETIISKQRWRWK